MQDSPTTCLIGLGGNIGPVEDTFVVAMETLGGAGCHVVSCSGHHQSAPMGSNAGETFTNAVARLITDLSPLQLLDLLQKVEDDSGRKRTVRWGPRTLDLDLLFYGQQVIHSKRLRVPHPDLWYRHFVLIPLAEIASDWKHPGNSYTIGELRARLSQRPLVIEVDGMETLPSIPDRYSDGVADVRSAGPRQVGQSFVHQPFCYLRVHTDDHGLSRTAEFAPEDFQIDVRLEDVAELIDTILSAALGN